ncbi:hypothetical protein G6F46_007744 [Rhizopus delemar]|uniref:Swiss Army Knife RNA repair protein HAD domain-containing protein n=2 Tax=Rhizopus TaxID=4842 RepID=A0A9P6Z0M7_9FUNG|nr:hypothetical protein G6F55_004839 [Rhizopus delemar]KAG1543122.1 hypothetical protein G6F51_006865 [Rhizopus arrhizus]KAG1498267.1 hypothetical protein G6F54_005198 [Rhizopus delemar]KAG1500428.1 hypothetical protein G6F53_011308 [Rhizopus delemar]KAG1520543.1 hypothetical protein G6F52_007564 [Rhizopus delemar]
MSTAEEKALAEQLAAEETEKIDIVAKEWIQAESEKEVKRIRDVGSSVIPLKTLNCGIIPNFDNKKPKAINRIELDTNVDLSKIQQIMVSPAIPYPHKEQFNYVNLILVTGQPVPFLAPYLYQTNLKVTQPEREEDGRKYPSKQIVLKNDLREYFLINKNGICARFTIHEYHNGILQRQFEASRFVNHPPHLPPRRLAVFDFDNTLFFSPQLSPTIWHSKIRSLVTAESVYGPGWWRDVRSLELGPLDDLKQTAWKGYWNEEIVSKARACIQDPHTMTVVLTGRRHNPFSPLVPTMLEAKGLKFDLIGLRPDPEAVSEYRWKVDGRNKELNYNLSASVFQSTMHFKQCFLVNILHHVPTIKEITMWDDRVPHLKRFKDFLNALHRKRLIDRSRIIEVPSLRPKYNPKWEKDVMTRIVETHNLALLARNCGKTYGKIDDSQPREEDPLSMTEKYLGFVPTAVATSIQLSPESMERLKQTFEPLFQESMERYGQKTTIHSGAESPLFFGDFVQLESKIVQHACCGNLNQHVSLDIMGISQTSSKPWLLLKVAIKGAKRGNHYHILPLWYKPSEEDLVIRRSHHWVDPTNSQKIHIEGRVVHEKRITVVESTQRCDSNKKQNIDLDEDAIHAILNRASINLKNQNDSVPHKRGSITNSNSDHIKKIKNH